MVTAYVVTAIGLPVYLHYCGGELEKINYVLKSDSCCDGEEDDSPEKNDGCCKDENFLLINDTDFTLKHADDQLVKALTQSFYIALPYSTLAPSFDLLDSPSYPSPLPVTEQDVVVSTSVIRV